MMVAGIIAEYNPFHRGHAHHIEETRRQLSSSCAKDDNCRVVVVMSGHAVQRGDFPILTKYARAEMAVRAGADLVFELGTPFALSGAERFARAGVSVLRRLGFVTHLSFGTEGCADVELLRTVAEKTPPSYPKHLSLARAYPVLFPEYAELFTPNNILGLEYLRALAYGSIEPLAVPRKGGSHDGGEGWSASAARRRLLEGQPPDTLSDILPPSSVDICRREFQAGRTPIRINEPAVLSYLRRLPLEAFAALPEVNGGLHVRLYESARHAESWDGLIARAKTKRFTAARLRRAFMCAFLGITEELSHREDAPCEPPLRLLAIGKHGRELLASLPVPILSRPAAHREALLPESRVTDQLALCMPHPAPAGLEWTSPVFIDDGRK